VTPAASERQLKTLVELPSFNMPPTSWCLVWSEGSVRKAANRVRITGQLIGAACLRQQERRACHGEDAETSNDKRVRPAEFATVDESEGESSKRRTHAGVYCFWVILITTSSQSSLNVRFGPNATELLHRREMTRRA
jgi:hypothetical protein